MVTYQTALYKVKYLDEQFGWDYDELLFESHIYLNPTDAMVELDFYEPTHNNWFMTMRMMKNGQIVEEDLFDSSVIEYPF